MIYPSIAILRSYAPYLCVGSSFIFSSMRRFSSSVTQNFICMFRFRFAIKRLHFYKGLGYPNKHFSFSGKGPENTEKSQVGTHLLCLLLHLFLYLCNPQIAVLTTCCIEKRANLLWASFVKIQGNNKADSHFVIAPSFYYAFAFKNRGFPKISQ